MMLTADAVAAALEHTGADDFYRPAHKHTFDAIQALYTAGQPVDTVTVAAELDRVGLLAAAGGPGGLVEMQASTPVAGNAEHYARVVADRAKLRRLAGVAGEIGELAYSRPLSADEALDQAEALVFGVTSAVTVGALFPIAGGLDLALDRLEKLQEHDGAITGTPTGYTDLDGILGGLQLPTLKILGARPAMGKTSLALSIAAAAAIATNLLRLSPNRSKRFLLVSATERFAYARTEVRHRGPAGRTRSRRRVLGFVRAAQGHPSITR